MYSRRPLGGRGRRGDLEEFFEFVNTDEQFFFDEAEDRMGLAHVRIRAGGATTILSSNLATVISSGDSSSPSLSLTPGRSPNHSATPSTLPKVLALLQLPRLQLQV